MPKISDATPLDTGDAFPAFNLKAADGSTPRLPAPGRWSVFIVYRGEW